MGLREYEAQWAGIIGDNMFSEDAVITDDESISLKVRGVFYSGSYEEESAAAYAPKKLVAKEFFQISSASIPEEISNPWKAFEGMTLVLSERGISFRVYEVAGKRGGTFTLSLQEVRDDS